MRNPFVRRPAFRVVSYSAAGRIVIAIAPRGIRVPPRFFEAADVIVLDRLNVTEPDFDERVEAAVTEGQRRVNKLASAVDAANRRRR